jgi:hypothetical protein
MNLDDSQRQKVVAWINEGLKLSDIQTRLGSELGLNLTYMEARLLVDDLKLTPKDIERPKAVADSVLNSTSAPNVPPNPAPAAPAAREPENPAPAPGGVSLTVDQIARPGAIVSGKVTFSDGKSAGWYLDQTGRLGLVPKEPGYRPSAPDVEQFQMALESELSRMGM